MGHRGRQESTSSASAGGRAATGYWDINNVIYYFNSEGACRTVNRSKKVRQLMYKFDGRIRYSEVDSERKLTVEKMIDYFQDCSSFQSEDWA